jgi:hypothetical protein
VSFVLSIPVLYNDPTGHDVGCSAANPACYESNGIDPSGHGLDLETRFNIDVIRNNLSFRVAVSFWLWSHVSGLKIVAVRNWTVQQLLTNPDKGQAIKDFGLAQGAVIADGMFAMTMGGDKSEPGFGGQFLDPEAPIVIFESSRGSGKIKTFDPLGNSAQSVNVAGSPEAAYQAAFTRAPKPGEPYWQTTAGQIGATGRYPYLDAEGSAGHVSIYGGDPRFKGPGEFLSIWTKKFFSK